MTEQDAPETGAEDSPINVKKLASDAAFVRSFIDDDSSQAGGFLDEFSAALGPLADAVYALEDILDAAERLSAGFPLESEEWYARRDYARIALARFDTSRASPAEQECASASSSSGGTE